MSHDSALDRIAALEAEAAALKQRVTDAEVCMNRAFVTALETENADFRQRLTDAESYIKRASVVLGQVVNVANYHETILRTMNDGAESPRIVLAS